jgi:hypothetical protein
MVVVYPGNIESRSVVTDARSIFMERTTIRSTVWEFRSKKLRGVIWIRYAGCEGYQLYLWAMLGAGSGVRTSSGAVAGGRKAGKSSPDPTDLLTNRVSDDCTRVDARILDKKHAIFLLAQSCHGRGSEG